MTSPAHALASLKDPRIGWPDAAPTARTNNEGWFLAGNQHVLRNLVPRAAVVFELGAYLGKSTRFIVECMAPNAHVITCDAWDNDFLEIDLGHNYLRQGQGRRKFDLYDTFLANLWPSRARVTPLKMYTQDAIKAVHAAGIAPDLIYIDADHDYHGVLADVKLCSELFPQAVLVGDDWDYAGVRQAVAECRRQRPLHVQDFKCWAYAPINVDLSGGRGRGRGHGRGRGRGRGTASSDSSMVSIHVPPTHKPRAGAAAGAPASVAAAAVMADIVFHDSRQRGGGRSGGKGRPAPLARRFEVLFDSLQAWDNTVCFAHYLEALAVPLDHGAATHKGRTLLMVAAMFGRERIVELLASRGANINQQAQRSGENALQLAAYGGHLSTVIKLLERGARRDLRTKYRETAEQAARANGQAACADWLRSWPKDPTAGTSQTAAKRDHMSRAQECDRAQGSSGLAAALAAASVAPPRPPPAVSAPAAAAAPASTRPAARASTDTGGDDRFLRARNRGFDGLDQQSGESVWRDDFYFVQMADPQFGMMNMSGENQTWEEEKEALERAATRINQLRPRPKFVIVCGDLVNAYPNGPEKDSRMQEAQAVDFKAAAAHFDSSIPLVCLCGNHDIGNHPDRASVDLYRSRFGDDYLAFWAGGCRCLVINTSLCSAQDPMLWETGGNTEAQQQSLAMAAKQSAWLEDEVKAIEACAASERPAHVLAFSHIPPFIFHEREPKGYFNLLPVVRAQLLAKLRRAGCTKYFCGHFHRNATAFTADGALELVTTGAVGCALPYSTAGQAQVAVRCARGDVSGASADGADRDGLGGGELPPLDVALGLSGFDWDKRSVGTACSGFRIVVVRKQSVTHHWVGLDEQVPVPDNNPLLMTASGSCGARI